jgi:coenzyme F420-0:L-glutamate ligase/coenzyme F420-1:gamma-L-glutamate ligase
LNFFVYYGVTDWTWRSYMQAKTVSVIGLENFPLAKGGDDLAKIIVETAEHNAVPIEDGDIVVVAQKVVSKAESRVVKLTDVKPSDRAKKMAKVASKDPRFVELVLKEATKILKCSPETLIIENEKGLVCINAGIDKSNVSGKDIYALLPIDPDESAEKIRSRIMKLTGKRVAVVISDTYSRPFRKGQVEFAIGIAGIKPFKDYRGQEDLFNYVLKVKNVALADEIASAAELVMGQGREAVPVAIIKKLNRAEPSEVSSIEDLNISREEDLFRYTL